MEKKKEVPIKKRAPEEELKNWKPNQEQIDYLIDRYVWISVNKEAFIHFCRKKTTSYRTMSSLRVGFDRFLNRKEKIDQGNITTHDLAYQSLSNEELIQIIKLKDATIDSLKNDVEDLEKHYRDALEQSNSIENDETISLSVKAIMFLRERFGKDFDKSFFNNFLKFMFENAIYDQGNGKRYDKEQYQGILAWLKQA